jgi:protein TonB
MARAAAIEGDGWSGAGSALATGGARLLVAPRRDHDPSAGPARGDSGFAALVSLVVHAAIAAAAALSLGATQPTGEPNAIAVELAASTGETPAAPTPTPDAGSTPAASALTVDVATSVPTGAPQPTPPQPTETSDAAGSTPAETPDAAAPPAPNADVAAIPAPKSADATDMAPPAPTAEAAQAVAAPAAVSSPAQAASAPPEADFAAAPAPPRAEPKPAKPPAERTVVRLEPAARPSGARAASAPTPAPARGGAELAAYRNALLAKIWGAARYPEAARERGAIGVATVRFALDGAGAVTLADLAQSSGDRALDDEAMAAVRRASPLPAPPTGAPRAYSAPIRFELR